MSSQGDLLDSLIYKEKSKEVSRLSQEKENLEKQIEKTRSFDPTTILQELRSLRIFDDKPGLRDVTRVLYYLREKLAVGMSEHETSAQDSLVLAQLNLRKIVQLEQRRKASGAHEYDEGYWTLTELGKNLILYLQTNKQILDKEGCQR